MIDSHQHFWNYDPVRHSWIGDHMKAIRRDFQPEDLQPLLKKNNLAGSVVVQVDQTEGETLSLIALANTHTFIKGVVGWIDLRNSNLGSRLEYFSSLKKLKGFRHIVQGENPGFLGQPAFINGVRNLARYDFAYDLLIYHHQLAEALTFVKQIRDTKIVIDHIAKPSIATKNIAQWRVHMKSMAESPNVYCKVSGMVTEASWSGWVYEDFVPYLEAVTDAFGSDRIMYGSDWPVCLLASSYEEQFSIVSKFIETFSPDEKKRILGGNAERFYNL
jgi:L-fuconolactonase